MHYSFSKLFPALCALSLAGCANLPSSGTLGNGETYVAYLDTGADGYQRSYRVHIPSGYRPDEAAPLVVVVHGAFSTSKAMEQHTGFSTLADKEGFVAVYPDGIGILGLLQHWNAGHCCGKAATDEVDDVGFIANVIGQVKEYVNIDSDRVYMVGFSNGAMLTHRFAAERSDLLAAAAPLAGSIGSVVGSEEPGWRMPSARSALPIIMFHGLLDGTIPYSQSGLEDASSARRYSSVGDSTRYWSLQNGCTLHDRAESIPGADVTVDIWSGCDRNATVQLFTLKDWGHRWPGPYFTDEAAPEGGLQGFDAAQIIWSFFQRHVRDQRGV